MERTCAITICGGLNNNDHHRLICLNASSLVGRTVFEGLGGMVFLEEVYHFGEA